MRVFQLCWEVEFWVLGLNLTTHTSKLKKVFNIDFLGLIFSLSVDGWMEGLRIIRDFYQWKDGLDDSLESL